MTIYSELEFTLIRKRMMHFNVLGLSIALIDNGNLTLTESFGVTEVGTSNKVTNSTVFNACSISKLATTMLVMNLVKIGLLELDQDINDKLVSWKVPENECTRHNKVTLRRLLSHQSGIKDPEGSFGECDSNLGIPTMLDLLEGRTAYCPQPIQVTNEPGSSFEYSDAGYCLIQQLIEDVSGKSFNSFINEMIFEPLLMKESTFDLAIPEGEDHRFACGHNKYGDLVKGKYPIYPYPAAAGLWSTSKDLAKLGIEIIHCLNGSGKLNISQQIISEMISPQGLSPWSGLGVFLNKSERGLEVTSLGWGIGYQCMLVIHPFLGTGGVIMTNSELGIHQDKGIIGEIIRSLNLDNR